MKKLKKYEVGVPVEEIWVFEVEAASKKEAFELASSGDKRAHQICSTSGAGKYVKEIGVEKKPRTSRGQPGSKLK